MEFSIDPSFQGVNILFVLSYKDDHGWKLQAILASNYHLPKDYVMIDGRNLFDQRIKNDLRAYDHIRKIATGQGDDYTTGCLLCYPIFKKQYKLLQ